MRSCIEKYKLQYCQSWINGWLKEFGDEFNEEWSVTEWQWNWSLIKLMKRILVAKDKKLLRQVETHTVKISFGLAQCGANKTINIWLHAIGNKLGKIGKRVFLWPCRSEGQQVQMEIKTSFFRKCELCEMHSKPKNRKLLSSFDLQNELGLAEQNTESLESESLRLIGSILVD